MKRIIACVDMDAFFASVEQRDDPSLRGKTIAVTGAGDRTVITTSSYEARKFGVKTGMTPRQAQRLCPHIIFVTANNYKYRLACEKLEQVCLRFTPDTEIYSIDEVFLDITGSHHLFGGPESLARSIKEAVSGELALTCTVGLGPNVLIAKLASDLAKPDGLRWIKEDETASVLEDLPVKKLWGIGPHTEKNLRDMGITTCGALGRASLLVLTRKFGSLGQRLKEMGNGKFVRPIETVPPEARSIGHSTTLAEDISKRGDILGCLLRLSEKVGRRARRYGYEGRRITLTIRYSDFKTFTRQMTLSDHTCDTGEIYRYAVQILDTIDLERPVRLLGISLSLFKADDDQMPLFEKTDRERRKSLARAVDEVNDKFGEYTVVRASIIEKMRGPA
jgi:DNA polymerase IV